MCVKLVKDNISQSFDPSGDFLEQTKNCTEVIVQYQPDDEEIKKFLQEMQKCAKNGTSLEFDVSVNYGDYLSGFRTKKEIRRALSDISLNEIIKLMTLSQHNAAKKLEEISELVAKSEVSGK